ncbi:VWA domain-containing protein [Aeromonas media]|uniref:VWA domain-containing protein n=1 Tax=Aeromonas media TaxID=651 RepID=UPI001CF106DF|nr:VWA domain-containing protein [Aeromonas media]UCP16387.1 VWA domain-containing protein [Aeromonas media]
MQISQVESAALFIQRELHDSYAGLLEHSDSLASQVTQYVEGWKSDAQAMLANECPFAEHAHKLNHWLRENAVGEISKASFQGAVKDFLALCKASQHPADPPFWQKQVVETFDQNADVPKEDKAISCQLLGAEWLKVLDKARTGWELTKIEQLRRQLMERLETMLKLLQQLQPLLEGLGLDPGLLVDLSSGHLATQDLVQFQHWASYLANDKGLHALCDLLGKIRQIELSEKIERVKINHALDVYLPDINSREEIVGIRLGRDLEYVLPSEKALLADAETALLFDLKFVESRLMSFDMAGIQTQHLHVAREEDRQVNEEDKRGPMILCVDTSGSMNGAPETIAKAMTLFLATKAREEQRPCYLINFSTSIETLELTGKWGLAAIIGFLKMSFHGGTDAAPALGHALKTMAAETYQKADLLIISDFIMADLPPATLANIEKQRGEGNRFYSLVVGSAYMVQRLKSLFDHEWVYNPTTSTIHELIGFQQKIDNKFEVLPV